MSLNQQLLQQSDPIILRSKPRIRKPRSQEVKVLLESRPLTIVQVKTVKGDTAYKFKVRDMKYAYQEDMRRLASRIFRIAYPRLPPNQDKMKARKQRYYQAHKTQVLEKQRQRRKRNFTT